MRLTATLTLAAAMFVSTLLGHELEGLWRAKRNYGPEVRGTLTIQREGEAWRADIAGRTATVRVEKENLSFELPDEGSFRGRLRNDRITGHWIQPRGMNLGYPYATPVTLERVGTERWRGAVMPADDTFTHFLPIHATPDGTLALFLRNPDRNIGRFLPLQRIALEGTVVKLYGARGDAPERLLADGQWDRDNDRLSVDFPNRGGFFDFRRATPADEREFYPRGKTPAPYVYRKPLETDDGWTIAGAEEAGLSVAEISKFVQFLIDTPIDSVHAQDIHALLVARHGKLAVEEYFHGFHRDELHDTRSAAKVLADLLAGAAMQSGARLDASTPVYATLEGTVAAAKRDPRAQAMTLGHLISMSSGLDCDDADEKSGGNEDRMQDEHGEEDWTQLTMEQRMVRAPGEKAVYCSMSPNLAGRVIGKVTGRWLPDLFRDGIARPLQIRRYALDLGPNGDAYLGGGARLTARDFLKLAQLMLDGGRWRGKQVIPEAWARESVRGRFDLAGIRYGYLWWRIAYPRDGQTVEAFFAGGNGGQIAMAIPELDLALVFMGGNYHDPALFVPQREYVPKFVLPAVK
jgi:CubicO group peptidase (beta-lactamase class C family)